MHFSEYHLAQIGLSNNLFLLFLVSMSSNASLLSSRHLYFILKGYSYSTESPDLWEYFYFFKTVLNLIFVQSSSTTFSFCFFLVQEEWVFVRDNLFLDLKRNLITVTRNLLKCLKGNINIHLEDNTIPLEKRRIVIIRTLFEYKLKQLCSVPFQNRKHALQFRLLFLDILPFAEVNLPGSVPMMIVVKEETHLGPKAFTVPHWL